MEMNIASEAKDWQFKEKDSVHTFDEHSEHAKLAVSRFFSEINYITTDWRTMTRLNFKA